MREWNSEAFGKRKRSKRGDRRQIEENRVAALKSKRKRSKKEQSASALWPKRWTSKESKSDKRDLASKRKKVLKLNDSSVRRDLVKWMKLLRQAWRQSNLKKKEKLEWKDSESLRSRSHKKPSRKRADSIPIVGSKRFIEKINRKEVGRAASDGISQEANNSNGSKSDAMDVSLISCIIFALQPFFEIQIAKNSNMFSFIFEFQY